MDHTIVRCADGHLFSTSAFPMQNLGRERLGPGRLLRCPRCGRLRNAVPVDRGALNATQIELANRVEAVS